jgi:hypothetical protein
MIIRNVLLGAAGTVIICLALAGASNATVPRAFVSINGDDLNPCSATLPCRSFNQALAVVQAGGEIVVQNSGGYSTGFTINKSVTIDAGGFNASVVTLAGGDACTINAGASDTVVLRGISFHGSLLQHISGTAINVSRVGSLYVEHCSISQFNTGGVTMVNGGKLFATDTDIRACNSWAILAEPTDGSQAGMPVQLVAHDCRFSECGVGVLVDSVPFHTVRQTADAWLSNCTASCCGDGFDARSAGPDVDMTLINCRAVGNGGAGIMASPSLGGSVTVLMANCTVTGNKEGIHVDPGIASVLGTNPGTNFISGNTTDGSIASIVTIADLMEGPWNPQKLAPRSSQELPGSPLAADQRRRGQIAPPSWKDWIPVPKERTS